MFVRLLLTAITPRLMFIADGMVFINVIDS